VSSTCDVLYDDELVKEKVDHIASLDVQVPSIKMLSPSINLFINSVLRPRSVLAQLKKKLHTVSSHKYIHIYKPNMIYNKYVVSS
jgi:hypothetical protein